MFTRKHDCPACQAKDQTITALADQIDWLRAQLGSYSLKGLEPAPTHSEIPDVLREALDDPEPADTSMSEDEADIRWAQSQGLITPADAESALARIGADSTVIEA